MRATRSAGGGELGGELRVGELEGKLSLTWTKAFFKASAGLSWKSGCSESILGRFSMTNWEAFSPCLPWPGEGQAVGVRCRSGSVVRRRFRPPIRFDRAFTVKAAHQADILISQVRVHGERAVLRRGSGFCCRAKMKRELQARA